MTNLQKRGTDEARHQIGRVKLEEAAEKEGFNGDLDRYFKAHEMDSYEKIATKLGLSIGQVAYHYQKVMGKGKTYGTSDTTKKILRLLSVKPPMSLTEIARELGVSRQWVFTVKQKYVNNSGAR